MKDKLFVAGPRDLEGMPDSFGFETVRPRRKYVEPKVRSLKKQPGTEKIYESAVTDACNNIGNITEPIISALLSGQRLPMNWKYLEDINGKKLNFSPDMIAPSLFNSNYNDIVEVKTVNKNRRGIICKKHQIAKGAYHRLDQISQGNLVGDYKNVFVRYQFPMYKGVTDFSSSEIVSVLAESIKDMVILPFNLFLYNASFVPDEYDVSKKTESSSPVFHYSIAQNSALASGNMDLSQVTRPAISEKNTVCRSYNCDDYGALENDLMRLDLIDLAEYNFVDNVSIKFKGENYPVKPFPVKEYILTDPRRWNFDFSRNHSEILAKLRVQNYFAEREGIPIPELVTYDANGNPDWSVENPLEGTGTEIVNYSEYF